MTFTASYTEAEPALSEIETLPGVVLLEFGTPWCGHCQLAQAPLAEALRVHPEVHHIKFEDGKGRPVGRHYSVTLWPTFVLLEEGREVARLVRPRERSPIDALLARRPA